MVPLHAHRLRCLRLAVFGLCALGAVAIPATGSATEPGRDGFYPTGLVVRTDHAGREYTIVHQVKTRPTQRTAAGLVLADVEKRFLITPARDIPCEAFRAQLRAGLVRNGMQQATATTLASACSGGIIKARSRIVIAYSPSTRVTVLDIEKVGSARVSGLDAMKSVWGVWLGSGEKAAERAALSAKL